MTPKIELHPTRSLGLIRSLGFSLLVAAVVLAGAEGLLRAAGYQGSGDRTTTWFSEHILRLPL